MDIKKIAAVAAALVSTVAISGCAAPGSNELEDGKSVEITEGEVAGVPSESGGETSGAITPELPEEAPEEAPEENPKEEVENPVETPKPEEPQKQIVTYIKVTGDSVNIRSGAGTVYSAYGTAEKSTLYAYAGETGGWYKTYFKNKIAYISSKYCLLIEFAASESQRVESIIAEATKLMGVPYVYGAVRLHDGRGNFNKNFTNTAFDCSSLTQYAFYYGAGVILDVTTRTQIYQGKTVTKSKLERGDLMFFTNSSRYNKVGIERVGHVAIYLGDNYILHTSSDYAKIETISSQRWSYFIQGQRIL